MAALLGRGSQTISNPGQNVCRRLGVLLVCSEQFCLSTSYRLVLAPCSGAFRLGPQEHFTQMRVVGQFNLGFMICLLGSDLFILDQHACDEKYNFEVLQETTTIHQQPLVRYTHRVVTLNVGRWRHSRCGHGCSAAWSIGIFIAGSCSRFSSLCAPIVPVKLGPSISTPLVYPVCRPLPLETSASEEMTIIDNIALFERNGFRFTVRLHNVLVVADFLLSCFSCKCPLVDVVDRC